MSKKIIIIGGGIAGLSAGSYARMNGFETDIFEANHRAGGVCTSWERSGFLVNGSLHWLMGSAPNDDIYDMWHELGIIEDNTFHNHSIFIQYENIAGRDVTLFTNVDKLEQHFLDIAPEDRTTILDLTHTIRTLAKERFPMNKPFELFNLLDWSKVILTSLPLIRMFSQYSQLNLGDYAKCFKSEVLQRVFEEFWDPRMSMTFFFIQMAYATNNSVGYPLGGAGKFTERLEKRYRNLGGNLHFNQKVVKILTENDRAVGIKTEDGLEHRADYVISACDGHSVLFKMLDEKYVDEKLKKNYAADLEPFPSLFFFSMGVNRTFEDVPPSISGLNMPLLEPLKIGNQVFERGNFQVYNFDPTLAPKGQTLITAMFETDFDFWKHLYDTDHNAYRTERQRIVEALIRHLDHRFEGLAQQIVFTDAATPVTYEYETLNFKGSYEGWLPTTKAMSLRLPTHFKQLENFYMAGHWVAPGGGMPPAAYTGRDAVQLICKQEKKHFEKTVL